MKEDVVMGMQLGEGKTSSEGLIEAMEAGGGSVRFISGRPNVSEVINQELSISNGRKVSVDGKCPVRWGTLAWHHHESRSDLRTNNWFFSLLLVSGPSQLAESVRSALVSSSYSSPAGVLRGGPSVTLHTESFGW